MVKLRVNPFSLFTPIRLVVFISSTYNHEPMNSRPPSKLKRSNDRPKVFIWGLILSLLLHILVVLFFIFFPQQERLPPKRQPATVVQLVDLPEKIKKPQPDEKSEFEIDQQPVKTPPKTPVESFRKAEQDQKVEKEQAPEGEDTRDQTTRQPVIEIPQPPPHPEAQPEPPKKTTPPKVQKKAKPQPEVPAKSLRKTAVEPEVVREKPEKPIQPIQKKPAAVPTSPLSMEQLLPDKSTLDQVTRGTQADRNRRKKREDVEIGDEVWLTTQQNMLASFFRRLSDKIDLVWKYPAQARRQRIQGTVGLLIIVNKKGELIDVDITRTSGVDILDSEAIQAIYRAAPFGQLPKRYPHELLKIHANFSYRIGGRSIYGR